MALATRYPRDIHKRRDTHRLPYTVVHQPARARVPVHAVAQDPRLTRAHTIYMSLARHDQTPGAATRSMHYTKRHIHTLERRLTCMHATLAMLMRACRIHSTLSRHEQRVRRTCGARHNHVVSSQRRLKITLTIKTPRMVQPSRSTHTTLALTVAAIHVRVTLH